MLFLVVLGGAAVLEMHRALHHGGSKDLQEVRRKESELRRQLQDLQRELTATRSQRELTEREAAQLSAINAQLQADKAELEAQSSGLHAANEELSRRAKSLLERQQQLERTAELLAQENSNLLQQFDRLKIKYEQESTSFHEQLAELKQQVSGALRQFASGELSAEALLAFLSGMGVEVRCAPDDLSGLPDQLNSARSAEERLQILDKVELSVDDSWVHQLRLSSCPDRAARLLMASREAPASGTPALAYPQQPKKITTPNKDTPQLAAPKVPLLKLGCTATQANENQPQQQAPPQLATAPAPEADPAPAAVLKPVQENKSRSLRFLPAKKASKPRSAMTTPRLELQLGEGGVSAGIGLPRLGLGGSRQGAENDGELLGGGGTLMSR